MSKKKEIDRDHEAEADKLLLRALRQLADEALEEEIPERLLRPLREARGSQGPAGGRRGDKAAAPEPEPRRCCAGSS